MNKNWIYIIFRSINRFLFAFISFLYSHPYIISFFYFNSIAPPALENSFLTAGVPFGLCKRPNSSNIL